MRLSGSAAALCLVLALPAAAQTENSATAPGIVVAGPTGQAHVMTPDALAALPTVSVTTKTEPGHGPPTRTFTGPLLWTILAENHLVDATKFQDEVRQSVLVSGSDGYTAIIAIGEISPEFSNQQVILAEKVDDQELGPGHLRVVVPGDKRAGRGVHDVVRIQLNALPNTKR
jgi:hypothetical protein